MRSKLVPDHHTCTALCHSYGQLVKSANNDLLFGRGAQSGGSGGKGEPGGGLKGNEGRAGNEEQKGKMQLSNSMGVFYNGTCQLEKLEIVATLGTEIVLQLKAPGLSLVDTAVTVRIADTCPPGFYLLGEVTQAQSCVPCPVNKYLLTFSPDAVECKSCPEGATCEGGEAPNAGLMTLEGWWRASFQSDEVLSCPMEQNCLGGTETEANTCSPGSKGPLCGICETGFYNDGHACIRCGGASNNEPYVVGFVGLLGSVALWRVYKHARANNGKAWSSSVWSALVSGIDIQRAKIAWSTIQIITAISWTTDIEWPEPFKSVADTLTVLAEFSLVPVACIQEHLTYWHELLVATLLPLGLVALIWLVAMLAPPDRTPRKKATYLTLLLAFIVLPTTSTKIFRTYICLDFDEVGRFLAVDLSINCDSSRYAMMRAYSSIAIVLYPFGIPLGFLAVLYANRSAISNRDVSQPCPAELSHYAILFAHYTNGSMSMYWEVVECVRRLLLSSVVVFMGGTSSARTTWGALIALFFSIVCAEVQPCLQPHTQAFLYLAQWHVVLNFLLAVILAAGFRLFSPLMVGWLFVILTVLIVLGALAHGRKVQEDNEASGGSREGRRAAKITKAEPCVIICAPGRAAESQMVLGLLRVLKDLGHIELKAAIANLCPQQDRSRLVRKQLDSLGLHDVPVGVGTNGGSQHHNEAEQLRLRANSAFADDESDPATSDISSGGSLLEKTWDEAAPSSLTLLITSSLKVCKSRWGCAQYLLVSHALFVSRCLRLCCFTGRGDLFARFGGALLGQN